MSDNNHRWMSLVLILVVVVLFACRLYTFKLECDHGASLVANVALIAWKDFLLGAVVVAVIWFVRSLWE